VVVKRDLIETRRRAPDDRGPQLPFIPVDVFLDSVWRKQVYVARQGQLARPAPSTFQLAAQPVDCDVFFKETAELRVQELDRSRAARCQIDEVPRQHDEIDALVEGDLEHALHRLIGRVE
jgi:hypothetical protein